MYNMLKIKSKKREVVFDGQELVKIAYEAIKSKIGKNDCKLEFIEDTVNIDDLFKDLVIYYSDSYTLDFDKIDSYLQEMLFSNVSAKTNIMPLFLRNMTLLRKIEEIKSQQNIESLLEEDFIETFYPIPRKFIEINSVNGWLEICNRSFEKNKEDFLGWWIKVAGRLLHVINDPNNESAVNNKSHLYISDHGNYDRIIDQLKPLCVRNINNFNSITFCYYNFYSCYNDLSDSQKKIVEKNFISRFIQDKYSDKDSECTLKLFMSQLLPSFYQQEFIESINPYEEYKLRFIREVNEQKNYEYVSKYDYRKTKIIFDNLLHQIKFVSTKFGEERMSNIVKSQSVFITQLKNVFTETDANIFSLCMFLDKYKKPLDNGNKEHIFREIYSYGDKDMGSTYHEFERSFQQFFHNNKDFTDADLVKYIRAILNGQELKKIEQISFLPNLVGAWFVAETIRNPITILSNLCILDLVESQFVQEYENGENWFTWCNLLIHPEVRGNGNTNTWNNKGGGHPMAHKDSKSQGNINKDGFNTVRRKEANIFICWLQESLKKVNIQCEAYYDKKLEKTHFKLSETELDFEKKINVLNKKIIKDSATIRVLENKNKSTEEYREKVKKNKNTLAILERKLELKNLIIGIFNERLSSLELMLGRRVLNVNNVSEALLRRTLSYDRFLFTKKIKPRGGRFKTLGDGNCALHSFTLSMMPYLDKIVGNSEFRNVFVESYDFDKEGFSEGCFRKLIESLISPDINLSNPLIIRILDVLKNIRTTAVGVESNQIGQRLELLEDRFGDNEVNGIKELAIRGDLLQMALSLALRRLCVKNNGQDVIYQSNYADDVIVKLNTSIFYGEYAGMDELSFLSNYFGVSMKIFDTSDNLLNYFGNSDVELKVQCRNPGASDCHFDLYQDNRNIYQAKGRSYSI